MLLGQLPPNDAAVPEVPFGARGLHLPSAFRRTTVGLIGLTLAKAQPVYHPAPESAKSERVSGFWDALLTE